MEAFFKPWITQIAVLIEVGGAVIVVMAVLRVAFRLLRALRGDRPDLLDIRVTLGKWLVLALEFELAADIMLTAVAPTWNEIGKLAAIITLRTLLNFFLHREIDQAAILRREGKLEAVH